MVERLEIFSKEDIQMINDPKKMVNTISHQENANLKSQYGISSHSANTRRTRPCHIEDVEKLNPYTFLLELQNRAATLEKFGNFCRCET